jgi:hypothetical protein
MSGERKGRNAGADDTAGKAGKATGGAEDGTVL